MIDQDPTPFNPELIKPTKRELLTLGYESFGDSQGDQTLQTHFIQAVIRRMIEEEYTFDLADLAKHEARMGSKRPPDWHMLLSDPDLAGAQFRFWWRNILTVTEAALQQNPSLLPDLEALKQQAWQVGAAPEMSSFTDKEFALLDSAFEPYRRDTAHICSSQVMTNHLIPRLIHVELDWQTGEKFKKYGQRRPRSDTDDARESVWLRYSQAAHNKATQEKPLTARENLYLDIAALCS